MAASTLAQRRKGAYPSASDFSGRPDSRTFRSVFSQLPSGVTVITTVTPSGSPRGMTASAVCSLSLDPLLLLVCIDNRSRTLATLLDCGRFAVNILRDGHGEIADAFTGPGPRFAAVAHSYADGLPVLDDVLAWLGCRVHAAHPEGDHTIVVGAVTTTCRSYGEPLVWHTGCYRSLAPSALLTQ